MFGDRMLCDRPAAGDAPPEAPPGLPARARAPVLDADHGRSRSAWREAATRLPLSPDPATISRVPLPRSGRKRSADAGREEGREDGRDDARLAGWAAGGRWLVGE
jgi:hypothetical protein